MTASSNDFCDVATLDGYRPGDLVRTRPVFVAQLSEARGAWQVIYVSANSRSEPIAASGIVLIPEAVADPGATAILVYCPGFRGLGGVCAPSQLLAIGAEPDTTGIDAALRRGWVVAIPDGEGLGLTGDGPHTFLAARAGGRVALDLARAVYRGADLGVAVAPVVAWGYADGGRAVAAAGELHPWYAPELDLRGIAAGAVASDLAALAPAFNRGEATGLGLAALVGLSHAYEHLPLRHVLSEDGVRAVEQAQHLTAAELLQQFPQPVGHWCRRPEPWNDHWWRRVLAMETLAHTRPAMPLHLYHGGLDIVVPVRAGRRTLIAYRQRGTQVDWREYDADHRSTAHLAISDVLARLTVDITSRPPHQPPTTPVAPEAEHTSRP
ncbi:Secretory lipase [Nocardia amikacinitolerans]|uniref:lipase family protein n=1 Tax=Nocardia amikacinitolerans TaxID=756689 RepID=UPI0008351C9F|nr:lipase family protein [Nocardia amikacinitolerans]MCP2320948.1 Secretory lipase [Nocardia amikacinitolerans]